MRLWTHIRRILFSGAALTALLAAAPASADLSVVLTGPADGLFPGTTQSYEAVITNNGAAAATGVELDATLPASLAAGPLGADAGCTTTAFPCGVGTIAAGASATVTFKVDVLVPSPLPATCPAGDTADVTVTATATGLPDATDTVTSTVNAYADVEVAIVGPASASEGQSITFDTTVTNNGPCIADAVLAEGFWAETLTLESSSGTCTGADLLAGCDLGDMDPGASVTFSQTMKVGTLPSDVIQAGVPFFVSASADTTHDQDPGNNDAQSQPVVDTGNGGCSTGGAGTLLGLLSLVGLRLGRRRSR